MDLKPDKERAAGARRQGAIILVLTCASAPLGLGAWTLWGGFAGVGVYGLIMLAAAVLWALGVRHELRR